MENSEIAVDSLDKRLAAGSRDEKIRAYYQLNRWMKDGTLGAERIESLFEMHRMTASDALDRDAMTAAELAVAARTEPLLEIGGHTMTHARLALLDEATALEDIRQNKARLESIVDREVRHFAYPYGDEASCGAREFRLAKAAGFETAVTSRIGNLFPDHMQHRWCLPRLRFLGPCENLGFMECQRSGAVTALATRFGNPVKLG
jgi:peptidoglycan/xylan/chitin deacetylase (PgdA/CDA1 family)